MFNFSLLAQGYQIAPLQPDALPEVMALQARVHALLGEGQKSFITPKTFAQFTVRMTEWGLMCGVRSLDTGRLAGYGNLVLPSLVWPKGDMALPYDAVPYDYDQYAVLQSCVVNPDDRCKGLASHIIRTHEALCIQNGRGYMMAEVVLQNLPSLKGFLSCGYQVIRSTIDPADGSDLLYVGKDLLCQPEPWSGDGHDQFHPRHECAIRPGSIRCGDDIRGRSSFRRRHRNDGDPGR